LGLSDAYRFTSQLMVENMLRYDAAEGIGAFLESASPLGRTVKEFLGAASTMCCRFQHNKRKSNASAATAARSTVAARFPCASASIEPQIHLRAGATSVMLTTRDVRPVTAVRAEVQSSTREELHVGPYRGCKSVGRGRIGGWSVDARAETAQDREACTPTSMRTAGISSPTAISSSNA